MRVDFIRTGGFGGIRLTTSVETTQLPPDQAVTIHKLLDDSRFFDLPENIAPPRPVPDSFQYRLTVASAEQTHTVTVSDTACPDSLRPLIDYLTKMAMVTKNQ